MTPFRRSPAFALACLCSLFALPGLQAFVPGGTSGEAIMEEQRKRHSVQSEIALIRLITVSRSGDMTQRDILNVVGRQPDNNRLQYLMRFTRPEEVAGTTLLAKEDEDGSVVSWLYLPALGVANRITGESQSGAFMGSDFSYEDLQKESTTDYEYTLVNEDRVGDVPAWKIVAMAKSPGRKRITGYSRRILYVDKENYNTLKIEFFDQNNVLIKTLHAFGYDAAEVEGTTMRPHRAVMTNHETETTSIITVLRSRVNQPVDNDLFTLDQVKSWSEADTEQLLGNFEY
ncbi:MAG: outer membrane lipoprotein-sorting protein [Opitutales bacterium]